MKKILWTIVLCLTMFLFSGFESRADEDIVIVIDAGHGGENLGAQVGNVVEKDINLKVANAMYKRLSYYDGIKVYMTHDEDEGLSLKKRATIAKEYNADYLISLHFNASENHNLYGTECWVPFDNFYEESYTLASYFIEELTSVGLYNRGIKTRLNDDGDNYYGIIRESETRDIPCVLVEHCHLDNINDEGYYETDEKLEELGILDAEALAKYLKLTSKRLGTDYSEYSLDVDVPLSENTRDKTGPSECNLTVKEYDKLTGQLQLILTAREEESRLLYYDYSIDGGLTYSEHFPMTTESVDISLELDDGISPNLVARAYSLNDAFTESNSISLETVEFPKEEDIQTITLTAIDKEKQAKREKMLVFFVLVMAIVILCFVTIITLYMIKTIQRKKRRKKKYQQYKKTQE